MNFVCYSFTHSGWCVYNKVKYFRPIKLSGPHATEGEAWTILHCMGREIST